MSNHEHVEVDPIAVQRASELWANFVKGSKVFIYGTATILILMALAFVDFF